MSHEVFYFCLLIFFPFLMLFNYRIYNLARLYCDSRTFGIHRNFESLTSSRAVTLFLLSKPWQMPRLDNNINNINNGRSLRYWYFCFNNRTVLCWAWLSNNPLSLSLYRITALSHSILLFICTGRRGFAVLLR